MNTTILILYKSDPICANTPPQYNIRSTMNTPPETVSQTQE